MVSWWHRIAREKRRAAAVKARLGGIRRHIKGGPSPFEKITSPKWRKRIFTALTWLGGWILIAWSLSDWLGLAGWKIGIGALLLSSGGLAPLARIVLHGLVAFPPWDWFGNGEDDK